MHSEREAHLKRIQQLVEETSRFKAEAARLVQNFTGLKNDFLSMCIAVFYACPIFLLFAGVVAL